MIKRLSRIVFRIIWISVATTILVTAVFASLVRLMLPSIGDYREELEEWAAAIVGCPVAAGSIAAEWQGWAPNIHLTDVSLLDPTHARTIIRFDRASISIDLLVSLRQLAITPGRLTISGVKLTLSRAPDGTISVEGLKPRNHALARWLLQQRNLTIQSARITWYDRKAQLDPVIFEEMALRIRSDRDHHQLEGSGRLPSEMGESFKFALDLRGDLLTQNWSGELYLKGQGVNPATLLTYGPNLGFDLAGGQLQVRSWISWTKGKLIELMGDFAAASMVIRVNADHSLSIEEAKGRFAMRRISPNGWRIDIDKLAIATPNRSWPENALSLVFDDLDGDHQRDVIGYASFLPLEDLAPLLPALAMVPADFEATVTRMQPRGDLLEACLEYYSGKHGAERFFIHAKFSEVTTLPVDRIPGVNGLTGTIEANAMTGLLRLSSSSLRLDFKELFEGPLWLDKLSGDLRWHQQDRLWRVSTPLLEAVNQDLEVQLTGAVEWAPASSPTVGLIMSFHNGRLDRVSHYLPVLVPVKARRWLSNALVAGAITSGRAVLRGPLDQFPFDQHQGRFAVHLKVSDGILEYSPKWPRLEQIEAGIVFEGRALTVHASRGKIFNADLEHAMALIPDLGAKQKRVEIRGRARGAAREARRFVMHSPLKGTVGKRIKSLAIKGKIALDLGLKIPLGPEKKTVEGKLSLPRNTLKVAGFGVELTKLSGALSFTEKTWSGKGFKAQLFGRPVRFDLEGNSSGAGTWASIQGQADRVFIAEWLTVMGLSNSRWVDDSKLLNIIEGTTHWQVKLNLSRPGDGLRDGDNMHITSELVGLKIDAPAPLGKAPREFRRLDIKGSLAASATRRIKLEYGSTVKAEFTLANAERRSDRRSPASTGMYASSKPHAQRLQRTLVHLGKAAVPVLDPARIRIGGALAEFSLSQWADFLAALRPATPSSRSPFALPRTELDLRISRLEMLGQWFDHIDITGRNRKDKWVFTLHGKDAAGTIQIPYDLPATAIEADFDRLKLTLPSSEPRARELDPSQFPALSVNCKQFTFASIELGEMVLRTRPDSAGLKLDALSFVSPAFTIDARGRWQLQGEVHASRFEINVRGPDLGNLLNSFGYHVTQIEGGKTALEIHAWWPGTPADFVLANLNGTLKIDVTGGRLLNVKNGVGRIFGLLSLHTLPRRLSLDFNDLFKKGFTFDKLEGEFEIENGNAYTNNLSMYGPSARIEVTGRTGLACQDYDQRVTVIPALASSLPVAGALFGPMGVGVGAAVFLTQKMFSSLPEQIDKMVSRQYSITGTWDKPVIKKVQSQSKDSSGLSKISMVQIKKTPPFFKRDCSFFATR